MPSQSEISWNIRDIESELTHLLGKTFSPTLLAELKKTAILSEPDFRLRSEEHTQHILNLPLCELIDHTLLSAQSQEAEVTAKCAEAIQYSFKTVCINSRWIQAAATALKNQKPFPIAVVGFPLGAMASSVKAQETAYSIEQGAQEIDTVISIGDLKSENFDAVFQDIASVVQAAKNLPVKVIIETSYLTLKEKIWACLLSVAAKAAFVKTSTGFATPKAGVPTGATLSDVQLMSRIVWGSGLKVKASGGIRTKEDALVMLQAGASRLGTSNSIQIIQGDKSQNQGQY